MMGWFRRRLHRVVYGRLPLDHPETCWCGGSGELLDTFTGRLYPCDGYCPPIPGVVDATYRGPAR